MKFPDPHQTALLLATVFAAVGQLFFKKGATALAHWSQYLNSSILTGLVFYAAGTVLWVFSLSRIPLRQAYPFTALTFVLVYFGAALFLKEAISFRGVAGTAVVLLGLGIIVLEN